MNLQRQRKTQRVGTQNKVVVCRMYKFPRSLNNRFAMKKSQWVQEKYYNIQWVVIGFDSEKKARLVHRYCPVCITGTGDVKRASETYFPQFHIGTL